MEINKFSPIYTNDPELNRVQDNIAKKLAEMDEIAKRTVIVQNLTLMTAQGLRVPIDGLSGSISGTLVYMPVTLTDVIHRCAPYCDKSI